MLLLATAMPAAAQPQLEIHLIAEKQVQVPDGEGRMQTLWWPVEEADPGDLLRYTLHYANRGSSAAVGAALVDPIPGQMVYLPGSAEGKNALVTFSLDGQTFQAPSLLTYEVSTTGGTREVMVATPEMYTHIRWQLTAPVPPGGTGSVSFMARVR